MNYTARKYQERTTQFVIDHKRCALWQQMGLGKTAAVLDALQQLLWSLEVKKILVVAPVRVAHTTWPDELRKWDQFKDVAFTVIKGTPKVRKQLLKEDTDIHLINPELLPWLVEWKGSAPGDFPYDTIVIDEPRGVRRPSATGFKTLRKIMRTVNRMIQMTGTPAPNGMVGLWGPAFLLDGGRRLGKTRGGFLQRWFYTSHDGYTELPRPGADSEIQERMADLTVAMRTEDYLELPPCLYQTVKVELDDDAFFQYLNLEREMFLSFGSGHSAEAFNAAALNNKCLQCANGAVYHTSEEGEALKTWSQIHDAKLDALGDLIQSACGAPVLVAYSFKSDLERITHRYPHARVLDKKPSTIAEWNRGEIELLVAHPGAAGHGLNLQEGGSILIWFGLTWNLEHYQQMNKRLHRSGQTQTTTIHHLVATGTLDEDVLARLSGKASVQDLLFARMDRRQLAVDGVANSGGTYGSTPCEIVA